MECEKIIKENPYIKINLKNHEPKILPKTIYSDVIERLIKAAYKEDTNMNISLYPKQIYWRNIAVWKLLFASGMRVSELCTLKTDNINLVNGEIRIWGKGAKERIMTITNPEVLIIIREYRSTFILQNNFTDYLFRKQKKEPAFGTQESHVCEMRTKAECVIWTPDLCLNRLLIILYLY